MRLLLLLPLAAVLTLSLPACAQKSTPRKSAKSTAKTTPKKVTAEAVGPVITFERTVCFGMCPAYKAQVFGDGRVIYNGQVHVPVTGEKELKLPVSTVNAMLSMARENNFSQLQATYSKGVTDVPSTIIAVRQPDGQLKTVTIEGTPPDELQGLVNYLRGQFDPLAGIGVER